MTEYSNITLFDEKLWKLLYVLAGHYHVEKNRIESLGAFLTGNYLISKEHLTQSGFPPNLPIPDKITLTQLKKICQDCQNSTRGLAFFIQQHQILQKSHFIGKANIEQISLMTSSIFSLLTPIGVTCITFNGKEISEKIIVTYKGYSFSLNFIFLSDFLSFEVWQNWGLSLEDLPKINKYQDNLTLDLSGKCDTYHAMTIKELMQELHLMLSFILSGDPLSENKSNICGFW